MSTVNFNDTTPAAPGGFTNAHWQSDASGNISANLSLAPPSVFANADYTATATDQLIAATTGVSTVYMPASPATGQVLTVRNFTAGTITVNGNGRNIGGTATLALYSGSLMVLWLNPNLNSWAIISTAPSTWLNWAPAITASGSMTVSAATVADAQWLWLSASVIFYKVNFTCTLSGTASNQVFASSPQTIVGASYPQIAWAQAPSDGLIATQMFSNISASLGGVIIFRLGSNANLALGNWAIQGQGFYRIL